ncbi:MAG: putative lipid II flippase FtsW [candidate division NC10 bacterium]|nr:putative lipid II flippase FtsW [candidate division NC10 bacterium]
MEQRYDKTLWMTALILVGIGIVMIYSSSAIRAQERFDDPAFFLKRQLLWALLSTVAMLWAMNVDYRHWERYAPVLLLVSLLLLLLVLVPGVGIKINGAKRWLRLAGFSFQPSELAKFSLIVFLARLLAKKPERVGKVEGFLPPLFLVGTLFLLIALEPNIGTAIILLLIAFSMLFVGGCRISHLFLTLLGAVPLVVGIVAAHPHAKARVLAILDPSRVSPRSLYQLHQSFYALGPGGLLGRGLGNGVQKLFYLPEPHTDFIFAIVGEEMGFIGSAFVVGLFGILLWRGTRITLRTPDPFGGSLAMGITLAITLQAAVNIGMVVGLLPTTGVPLPFISFGGSSLVVTLLGVGVLLNISKHALTPNARLKTSASRQTPTLSSPLNGEGVGGDVLVAGVWGLQSGKRGKA